MGDENNMKGWVFKLPYEQHTRRKTAVPMPKAFEEQRLSVHTFYSPSNLKPAFIEGRNFFG